MKAFYKSKDGVVHGCDVVKIHSGVTLGWTLCDIGVPENAAFFEDTLITCDKCIKAWIKRRDDEAQTI